MSESADAATPTTSQKWTYGRPVVVCRVPWRRVILPVILTAIFGLAGVMAFHRKVSRDRATQTARFNAQNIASCYAAAHAACCFNKMDVRTTEEAIALIRGGVWSPLSLSTSHFIIKLSDTECAGAQQYLRLENGCLCYLGGDDPEPPGDDGSKEAAADLEWRFNSALEDGVPEVMQVRTPEAALSLFEAGVYLPAGGKDGSEKKLCRMYPLTAACRKHVLEILRFQDGFLYCTDSPAYGPYAADEHYGTYTISGLAADAESVFAAAKEARCKKALAAETVGEALAALRLGMKSGTGAETKYFRVMIYDGSTLRRVTERLAFENGTLVQIKRTDKWN